MVTKGLDTLQLVELLPQFLALRTPEQLERLNQDLERRVEARTAELVQTNRALESEIQERIVVEVKLQQIAEQERSTACVIQQMRQSLDLNAIFHTTTEEVRRAMRCDRTLIYRFEPDWSGQVIAESVGEGWNTILSTQNAPPSYTQRTVDQPNCVVKRLDGSEVLIRDTYLQEKAGGS